MKLTKKIQCLDCVHKCDIYEALRISQKEEVEISRLHATFRKHENICRQGNEATHGIYLMEGSAKLYIEGLNHRNIILYILKPHSYIGLISYFESPTYLYSVTALEDSKVCMIDLSLIKELYYKNHDLLLRLNHAFGKSVSNILNKLISLNQKQIRGRVAECILYLSELYKSDTFVMNLTRKELGEFSAISEENVVRILTEMKKEKIIETSGKEIRILDKKLLQKISEVG